MEYKKYTQMRELKVLEDPLPIFAPQIHFIEHNPTLLPHQQPFISAILYLKEMLKELFTTLTETQETSEASRNLFDSSHLSFISSPTFPFIAFLQELELMKEEGLFLATIKERLEEIDRQKEHWRSFIEERKKRKKSRFLF